MPPLGNFDDEHACVLAGLLMGVMVESTAFRELFEVGMPATDANGFFENAIPVTHHSGLRYDVIVRWHR